MKIVFHYPRTANFRTAGIRTLMEGLAGNGLVLGSRTEQDNRSETHEWALAT